MSSLGHLGRKTTDLAQKIKGRQILRFQLELIPYILDNVPSNVQQASFMWERGAKLQYTEPAPVNRQEKTVYWGNTLLKQTATVYKENDRFKTKEYRFKIQSISKDGKTRSTFAKTKIDLAKYCSTENNDQREVLIPISGAGNLKITIQATWLRHSSPENDAMTEISGMSLGKSNSSHSTAYQDLSGFEAQQTQLHKERQRQITSSPFTNISTPSSFTASPERPRPRGRENTETERQLSLKATPNKKRGNKYHDVDLEDQATPRMQSPRRPRVANSDTASGVTHGSDSFHEANSAEDFASGKPQPHSSREIPENFAGLISSDSDEEGGVIANTKRWFNKSHERKKSGVRGEDHKHARQISTLPAEMDLMNLEDMNSLRRLAREALHERDNEHLLRQQSERTARHLQADCEALAMSKSMLVERLREAEDRLLTARQEETMNTLVQAKIKLAQADYVNLELTGLLNKERDRVRHLKQRLTDLEAAYHSTLNSLDSYQTDEGQMRRTL